MSEKFGDLKVGERGRVIGFERGSAAHRQKLLSMGLTPGAEFTVLRVAPMGDPVEIRVRGADMSLRSDEAFALTIARIAEAEAMSAPKNSATIAIVGNPNCGKTTLFNGLTGAHQRVGNWGGVTVEKKVGAFDFAGRRYRVVDLPGIHSLDTHDEASSVDESIARDYVLSGEADLVVNIIDASNLEHGLYLTTQLLEMAAPVAVVLNIMDDLDEREARVDAEAVRRRLRRPVAAVVVTRRKQLAGLQADIERWVLDKAPPGFSLDYPQPIESAISELSLRIGEAPASGLDPRWLALRLLEGDGFAASKVAPEVREAYARLAEKILTETKNEPDTIIADARYRFAHDVAGEALAPRSLTRVTASDLIDRLALNRFLGIPIFLGAMYCLFWFTIALSRAFRPFFVMMSETFFVEGPRYLLGEIGSPKWLTAILADGLGNGLLQVVTFIPIIGFLYLFVSMLEESGYMARANFVMDRLMKSLGLPGNAFIPMVVGFGCNVPAIMSTRTMERSRDRIVAVLMSPFMSCGGRLAVYTVFVAAFFPAHGQFVIFGIYLLGILFAMLTSLLMKFSLLPEEGSLHVLMLPSYHWPKPRNVLINSWVRLKMFLFKVGKYIIPLVFLVKISSAWGTDGSFDRKPIEQSMLAAGGRAITPILAPMGVEQDNWPATVALLTGVLHKVVIVSTLSSIYLEQAQHVPPATAEPPEAPPPRMDGGEAPAAAQRAPEAAGPEPAAPHHAQERAPAAGSDESEPAQAKERSPIDATEAKARIAALWRGAATAKDFAAAVTEAGWSLAHGDHGDFVLIDPNGGAHPLVGSVKGASAKLLRKRMGKLDPATLPSVGEAQAKIQVAERARAAAARARPANEPEPAERKAAPAEPAPLPPAPRPAAAERAPQGHMQDGMVGGARHGAPAGGGFGLAERIRRAAMTVPQNLAALVGVGAPVRLHGAAAGLAPALATKFDGEVGALAYLILLLCYPCIATTAATARETSRRWTGFMVFWTVSLGYGAAVLFYQIGAFAAHPSSSIAWIVGVLTYFVALGAVSFRIGPRRDAAPMRDAGAGA